MSAHLIGDPKAFLDELTRLDFAVFLRRAWPLISGGAQLMWNWHFEAITSQLERVERGDCHRLIVNLPPRSGKSKVISICWIAWRLGRDPTLNFVGVSYSNDLSGKLARDCATLMQSRFYRELFPKTRISQKRSTAYDFDTTAGGGRLATSTSGTLTGRGGDIVVLDDVLKPEDAPSETVRAKVNEFFRSTLPSRLDDKINGAFILVQQRLHEDDPSGLLLEEGGWDHLSLPAIAPEDDAIPLSRGRIHYRRAGDLLHPEREPIEVLEQMKRSMGSMAYSAQYQQDPVPAVGSLILAEWFGYYDPATLDRSQGQIVQSWDTASKENPHNDLSSCVTALIKAKRVYVLDVFRQRLNFPDLRLHAIRLAREYHAQAILIEDQSSGTQLLQSLRADSPPGVPEPIRRRPEGDKIARVAGISAMIEAGCLHLPTEAPWLAEFKGEVLGFPNAKFDDQVDALSQLMIWVRERDLWEDHGMVYPPVYGHDLLRDRPYP